MIAIKQDDSEDPKLKAGFVHIKEMKDKRKRGRVAFYFDGKEKVSEIEITERK